MSIRIEYLASGDDKTAVQETLHSLSFVAKRTNGVEIEVQEAERQSGFFEELYVGTLIINIILPIATGLVSNAIWAWVQSRDGKVESPIDQDPEKPIKVQIDSVQILIVITEDNNERQEKR